MAIMEDTIEAWKVTILFFGPLREHVETETLELTVVTKSTIEHIIQLLGIENWIKTGLKAAIDGEFCPLDTILHDGAEIALLPPVIAAPAG